MKDKPYSEGLELLDGGVNNDLELSSPVFKYLLSFGFECGFSLFK